jgi:G6PDH family F420-dependent oxidoreductase
MAEFGMALSSEELTPRGLIDAARDAETAGFPFAMISDHFHPWIDRQGESPFVWAVIGGIAERTRTLRLGTGVTCPLMRMHPAIVAQAAATAATMMPGRFMLGLGSGEALNEHVVGLHWPTSATRVAMLREAIEVIRTLWTGDEVSFSGDYFDVETARLYTLPRDLPPILVAASGPDAAFVAAENDGLVTTHPSPGVVQEFEAAGGRDKPHYSQVGVCWAKDMAAARKTARHYWPTAVLPGSIDPDLPRPRQFEDLVGTATEEEVARAIVCGPDPEPYVRAIRERLETGVDHLYFHQVGPDQRGFMEFFQREVRPLLEGRASAAPTRARAL